MGKSFMQNNKKQIIKNWLFFAEQDLKVAQISFKESLFTNVCFHSQQAVEKSLKALLLNKKRNLPKTHDLMFLFEKIITFEPQLSSFKRHCEFLNQFYLPTRYPDTLPGSLPQGLPNQEDSQEALKFAQEIFEFTQEKLK